MCEHDRLGQARDRSSRGARSVLATSAALVLLVCAAAATAFEPADGTEFLWTNATGTTLVGYGRVRDGALEIEISGDGGEFQVLMIALDGTVVDLRGEVRDGRPFLHIAGRGTVDLAQLLAESGLILVMRHDDGTTEVMAPVGVDEAGGLPGGAGDDVADATDRTPADEQPGAPEDRPGPPEDRGPPEDPPGPPEDRPGPPEDRPGPPEDRPGQPEDRGPPEDRPGPPDDRGPPEELPEDPGPSPESPVEPGSEDPFAPDEEAAEHERDAGRRGTHGTVVMA